MNKEPEIMVSVYVPTYNHEKYIVQALDSILMQECSYPIEILVGEDKSSDNTRAVLEAYRDSHPSIIQYYFREENMSKKKVHNAADLRLRCKGKYIIALEGDDFWIDKHKVEKQVEFLETHPEYIAVAHRTKVVGIDGKSNGETYPECKDSDYTFSHYLLDIMPGQLTTLMMRNLYLNSNYCTRFIDEGLTPGDKAIFFSLLCQGKIKCMPEEMSCYRHIVSTGSSYSARYEYDFEKKIIWQKKQLEFAQWINNDKAKNVAKAQYYCALRTGLLRKAITINRFLNETRKLGLSAADYQSIIYRDFHIRRSK